MYTLGYMGWMHISLQVIITIIITVIITTIIIDLCTTVDIGKY